MGGIEHRHSGVLKELARLDERRDAPLIAEPLPGDGRKIHQLVSDLLAEIFMVGQFPFDVIPIGQFAPIAYAVDQYDFLEPLIHHRILDQAHERRKSGTRAQKVQALAMLYARIIGFPSTCKPSMMKCPFSKRSPRSRVVVKLKTVSFQW